MKTWMKRIWAVLAVVAVLGGAPAAARADRQDELRERFKDRYPDLRAAKIDGKIGETTDGIVEAVEARYLEKDDALRKLVEEENADRRELYKLIAEREKTTPEKVATRNAARNFEKAKPGEYLKARDGSWKKKK